MTQESHLPEPYSIHERFEVIELREGEESIIHRLENMDDAKVEFTEASERGDALLIVHTSEVFASQGILDARGLLNMPIPGA